MKSALLVFCFAASALAWNHVGHKAVAGHAYDLLEPGARARVDGLIRQHPDFAKLTEGGPADEAARMRFAFIQAAYWPDTIRGDLRFYDEAKRDTVPTAVQPGFPDMGQRKNWHYINVAFSTDGTAIQPPPPVNVLSQVQWIAARIGNAPKPGDREDPVYLLPWFVHLVGDVHQPLHCATRYRKGQNDPNTGKPWSDLGGNTVNVVGSYNLHAYWDDLLGITDTPAYIEGVIRALAKRPAEGAAELDPAKWVDEGAALAQSTVYSFGNEGGGKENPIDFTGDYRIKARQVALDRAALAGRRLAATLNQKLR